MHSQFFTTPSSDAFEPIEERFEPVAATSGFVREDDGDEDDTSVLALVENRLQIANYYMSFLETEIFGDDTSEVALLVQKKLRKVARRQLEETMGIVAPAPKNPARVELPFTPEELTVLKLLAKKVMSPEAPIAKAPVRPEVQVTTVAPMVEVKPVRRPVVTAAKAAPPPAPVAPPTKPRLLMTRKRQVELAERAEEADTVAPPVQRQSVAPPEAEGNRLHNAMGVHDRGGRKLRVLEFPDTGERIVQDFSPQEVAAARIPMPQGMQMTMVSTQIAAETVAASANNQHQRAAARLNGASHVPTE